MWFTESEMFEKLTQMQEIFYFYNFFLPFFLFYFHVSYATGPTILYLGFCFVTGKLPIKSFGV